LIFNIVVAGVFGIGFLFSPKALLSGYLGQPDERTGLLPDFNETSQGILMMMAFICGNQVMGVVLLCIVMYFYIDKLPAGGQLGVWISLLFWWLVAFQTGIIVRRVCPYMKTAAGNAQNPSYLHVEWDDWVGEFLHVAAIIEHFMHLKTMKARETSLQVALV